MLSHIPWYNIFLLCIYEKQTVLLLSNGIVNMCKIFRLSETVNIRRMRDSCTYFINYKSNRSRVYFRCIGASSRNIIEPNTCCHEILNLQQIDRSYGTHSGWQNTGDMNIKNNWQKFPSFDCFQIFKTLIKILYLFSPFTIPNGTPILL